MRIFGYFAAAISVSGFAKNFIGHSMFDCPEATETAPTRTSFNGIVFDALTTISNGPPASPGDRYKFQRPRSSAVVDFVSPRNVTVTLSRSVDSPQTCTGNPR